jgi:uncharacterized delta-60 repeat protein
MKNLLKVTTLLRKMPIVFSFLSLMILTIAVFASPVSQVSQDWVAAHGGLNAVAVAVDGSGNSYITGPSLQDAAHNFNEDFILIKYDAAGNQVWLREFDETDDATHGGDVPFWLTLDPQDNVIVTGKSFLNGAGTRFLTLKYDPNGTLLWKARSTIGFEARRVATDAAGNIYITGPTAGSSSANYVTIKYDPNGTQLWVKTYNGPSNFRDEPHSLAVMPNGTVAVTGRSSGILDDVATILYDTNGNELWVRRFDGAGNSDRGRDVAFGPAGEVYVGGYTDLTGLTDMLLIKYDAAGNQIWVRTYNGADNKSDAIARIAVDSQGNILTTGYLQPASFYSDFGTLKYDSNGNLLWVRLYDGPIANDEEIPRALAIGPNNSVYVTGYQQGSVSVATVKYDANGNQIWAATYNHPNSLLDSGNAIAVDALGNVIVAGQSPILTIRYSEEGQPDPTATPVVTPTPSATPTSTPTECVTNCLRSTQVRLNSTTGGVLGKVTVKNENGVVIPGATVSVTWTLPGGALQNQTATTTPKGLASFNLTGGAGTYTLTVTNITKSDYTFDPANSILSKSITR